MNKYQEALDRIAEKVEDWDYESDKYYCDDYYEQIEKELTTLYKLTRKQTPKKVVFEDVGYDPRRDVLVCGAKCPNCGLVLIQFDDDDLEKGNYESIEDAFHKNFVHHNYEGRNSYCERCGQKLDWGNYDE